MKHRLHLSSKPHDLPECKALLGLSGLQPVAHTVPDPGPAQPSLPRADLATGHTQKDLSRPLAGPQGETLLLGGDAGALPTSAPQLRTLPGVGQ